MARELDEVDRRLVGRLVTDGRSSVRALAKLVGLSDPSVHERLRRLERDGVVTGYQADVDPSALGGGTLAFVAVRVAPGPPDSGEIEASLRDEPSVLEAHDVAGDDCYLLKVRVATPADLAEVLVRIRAIPGVESTRTTMVLRTSFERPFLHELDTPDADPED